MATELENEAAGDDGAAAAVEGVVAQVHPLAKQVSDALLGAVFPLKRDHLVWVARENEAPQTLVSMIAGLPARIFASLEDVQRTLDEGLAESQDTGEREPLP